jgi:hypothetical protein
MATEKQREAAKAIRVDAPGQVGPSLAEVLTR